MTILDRIANRENRQIDIARMLAGRVLEIGIDGMDWTEINAAIVKRWSLSARERVLGMMWKILENVA